MTHAAITHDFFERATKLRDELEAMIKAQEEAQKALHAELVQANAVALLRKIARQSRVSDADRRAAEALASQLGRVA